MKKEDAIFFNQHNVEPARSRKGYGYTYFAKHDFKIGEEIMRGYGRLVDHQTSHKSVQIDAEKHYVPEKWTGSYWNHSCAPNAFMRTRPGGFPSLYALQKIKKGEEITYDYAMSEFRWSASADETKVACRCGARLCRGVIRAFSQLTPREQAKLKKNKQCAAYLFKLA